MTKFHFNIRRFCAVIIGIVFFLAGVLKLMDPVGAGLIVEEYFKFFHTGFLLPVAKPFAFLLSLLEAVCGIALITGVYRKLTAIVTSCLIVFFTIVTLILWIADPVMDCGCFGEAVHLTHGQTLLKNVILIVLACLAFIPFRDFGTSRARKRFGFWLLTASVVCMGVYSLLYIPVTDFTPFNLSSTLKAAESSYMDVDPDDYVSTFIYEKNGKEGTFTLNNLPDSTWTFVRAETVLQKDNTESDQYPELAFTDPEGNYRDTLAADGMVMVISAYKPEKLKETNWRRIASTLDLAEKGGFRPLLLLASASLPEGVPQDLAEILSGRTYFADYKTLTSLNRSNGGASYFNDGDLIEKWSYMALPDAKTLNKIGERDAVDMVLTTSTKGRLTFQSFFLYAFVVMAFI